MMNLMYCGNDKVFDGILISLLSIRKHTEEPITAYILTMDLTDVKNTYTYFTEEHASYLQDMLQEKNRLSRVIVLDIGPKFRNEMMASDNLKTSYTPYTLARLYASEFDNIPDRILYLDTDTVAKADIATIFDIDISEYEMAGVSDYLGRWFIDLKYMNAGVLYLNMNKIRETKIFEKAREMCRTKKMWFPDQTSLNKLIKKKCFLPMKFNEQRKVRKDTVIRHFCKSIRWLPFYHTVNVKPWDCERMHTVYKEHSFDDILEEYLTRISK